MKKSDKVYILAVMMVILASAEVNIDGITGALLQVAYSIICMAIAIILLKKSQLLEKQERGLKIGLQEQKSQGDRYIKQS